MKTIWRTLLIAVSCSAASALLSAYFVAAHWQSQLSLCIGGRAGDYLVTAAKMREGKSDELIRTLEWMAQTEFLAQHRLKNDQPTFEYSHQVLDAYRGRYNITLAPSLKGIEPPQKRIGDKGLAMLTEVKTPTVLARIVMSDME